MQQDAINISFDNRVEEHVAADRLYYQSTTWAKIDKIVAAILVLAGLLLVVGAGVRWWTVFPFPLAVLEWFNLLSPRPLVKRWWFKQNPKYLETYNLSFDPSGIHFQTKTIDSWIKWDQYTQVLENDRLLVLVCGRVLYTVIPKRAFENDDDVARFRSLVAEHIAAPREQSA